MRNSTSDKYKNYGPIPQNEYTTTNSGKSTDDEAVLVVDPQEGDTAYRQRLMKRQALHPSGRRKTSGWLRSWKSNGWRAESAARDDEDMRRNYNYVRKSSRPL